MSLYTSDIEHEVTDLDIAVTVPKRGSQSFLSSDSQQDSIERSIMSSSSTLLYRKFQSRLIPEVVEKPWLEQQTKKQRINYNKFFPWGGFCIGICAMALLIWDGYSTINKHKYCLVFDDEFSGSSLDPEKWTHDIQVGGFGNGQFEWTTDSTENSFVKDSTLFIKPTLTSAVLSEAQIQDDYTVDLLQDGSCTSTDPYQCIVSSNATLGTIINPVRSARVHTKGKGSIRYGRVEVTAKMPAGDWLWPAIWMLPVNEIYGAWPRSGEIDIAESRGNEYKYTTGGKNQISTGLHWGPESDMDGYSRTLGSHRRQRGDFSSTFHTFGLEWTPTHLFTYVDSKLVQVQYTSFNQYFWKRGSFPAKNVNNTAITDIWSQTGSYSTPFDQDFYLILNVAVGGTNGWFPDTDGGKPWVNAAASAKKNFRAAEKDWYSTWQGNDAAMQVKSVKMWQQCD